MVEQTAVNYNGIYMHIEKATMLQGLIATAQQQEMINAFIAGAQGDDTEIQRLSQALAENEQTLENHNQEVLALLQQVPPGGKTLLELTPLKLPLPASERRLLGAVTPAIEKSPTTSPEQKKQRLSVFDDPNDMIILTPLERKRRAKQSLQLLTESERRLLGAVTPAIEKSPTTSPEQKKQRLSGFDDPNDMIILTPPERERRAKQSLQLLTESERRLLGAVTPAIEKSPTTSPKQKKQRLSGFDDQNGMIERDEDDESDIANFLLYGIDKHFEMVVTSGVFAHCKWVASLSPEALDQMVKQTTKYAADLKEKLGAANFSAEEEEAIMNITETGFHWEHLEHIGYSTPQERQLPSQEALQPSQGVEITRNVRPRLNIPRADVTKMDELVILDEKLRKMHDRKVTESMQQGMEEENSYRLLQNRFACCKECEDLLSCLRVLTIERAKFIKVELHIQEAALLKLMQSNPTGWVYTCHQQPVTSDRHCETSGVRYAWSKSLIMRQIVNRWKALSLVMEEIEEWESPSHSGPTVNTILIAAFLESLCSTKKDGEYVNRTISVEHISWAQKHGVDRDNLKAAMVTGPKSTRVEEARVEEFLSPWPGGDIEVWRPLVSKFELRKVSKQNFKRTSLVIVASFYLADELPPLERLTFMHPLDFNWTSPAHIRRLEDAMYNKEVRTKPSIGTVEKGRAPRPRR